MYVGIWAANIVTGNGPDSTVYMGVSYQINRIAIDRRPGDTHLQLQPIIESEPHPIIPWLPLEQEVYIIHRPCQPASRQASLKRIL